MSRRPVETSIILPTFNRADTLKRAIDSVISQSYEDWELLIVDDGSTDETQTMDVSQIDPRIRLIRQDNAGVSAARNTGLASSAGAFIAFLDSDDEWLPHYLELCIAFLKSSPDQQYVTAEFYADDTDHLENKGVFVDVYYQAARMIGSAALDLPPGERDDYLRVFETRQPLGRWAQGIISNDCLVSGYVYQGDVFEYTRWGYLAWLPTTVLRRRALEIVGGFDPGMRHAGDYAFLAALAKHFRTSFISVPCARKHERGLGSKSLRQDHLATGAGKYKFRVHRLRSFDRLHWDPNGANDRELTRIRRHYVYFTGRIALAAGLREQALGHFREAADLTRPFWFAYLLWALAFCLPARVSAFVFRATQRVWELPERLWRSIALARRSPGTGHGPAAAPVSFAAGNDEQVSGRRLG